MNKAVAASNESDRNAPAGGARRRSQKLLNGRGEKGTTLTSSTLAVSIKTLDAEQTASSKQTARRLVCRAMIRLYLQDHGNPEHGERLGVL